MTLYEAFTAAARTHGHSPAVVFRDRHSGERTELSFLTLHNWVSKTANLLIDALDAGLGTEVRIDTPIHWLVPVGCLASWATGSAVTLAPGGDITIGHEADGAAGADLLIGTGMGGRPLVPNPGEALTVTDILAQPDDFVDDPLDEGAWVLGGRTQATVVAEAASRVQGATRVLWAGDRVTEPLVFHIAHTLCAGTGLVLARGYDDDGVQKILSEERADVILVTADEADG